MNILSILLTIIKFILILSFLVLIHEGGHFLTAKAVGMKVDEFAIGFGPKIWSKKGKETMYSIRSIPLGGFVALAGEIGESDDPRAFANKPVWAKLLVVVMGATVNIVFALVAIFFIVISQGNSQTTTVSEVVENAPAYNAGIQAGDKIVSINGKKMRVQNDITEFLRKNKTEEVVVKVLRNGEHIDFNVVPQEERYGYTGIEFATDAENIYINEISGVQVDSPAKLAGLQKGDKIISINNIETTNPSEISYIAYENPDISLPMVIDRNGELINLTITPVCPELLVRYVLGFYGTKTSGAGELIYTGFWEGIYQLRAMLSQIFEIFTGQISTKYLSGPIGIAKVVDQTTSWYDLLNLTVLISMNLGIVNLLPIPPLDGGKIVLLIIEGIRKKPVSEKVEGALQMLGFAFFIGLTIFVTFNDIVRDLSIF
ncbi:MAG: PDZ domain-containing protein [Clostridiales bacterium]|nr:PDZ domain-containing protein [Clostridiales bacterium]